MNIYLILFIIFWHISGFLISINMSVKYYNKVTIEDVICSFLSSITGPFLFLAEIAVYKNSTIWERKK